MNADLTCVTWNIHRAQGTDGRKDADRILAAIKAAILPYAPDILALQEADEECPPHAGTLDIARLSQISGLRSVHDRPALRWGPQSDGFLGTILFLRPDYHVSHADVIDLPGHCHRGAISVELELAQGPLRVLSTHLSLGQPLRIVQMRVIGQYLRRRKTMPTVILGDLNEWRPWGGVAFSKQVVGRRFLGPARLTFPSRWPVLPLDRVLCDVPRAVRSMTVLDSDITRLASDHLPVMAQLGGLWPESHTSPVQKRQTRSK